MRGIANAMAIMLLAILLLSLGMCVGQAGKKTETVQVLKQVHHYHVDTLVKRDTVKIVSKPKVASRKNSPSKGVVVMYDTIRVGGNELAITDTLRSDSISTRITRLITQDTTIKEAVRDTVWLEKTVFKTRKFGFAAGVGIGFVAGVAVGIIR